MKTPSQFGNLAAQNRTPVRLADWSICTRSERTNKRNEHRHNGVPVNIIYFRYSFPSNESIKIILFSLLFRSRQHPSDFVAAFLFSSSIVVSVLSHRMSYDIVSALFSLSFARKNYNNCYFKLALSIRALCLTATATATCYYIWGASFYGFLSASKWNESFKKMTIKSMA